MAVTGIGGLFFRSKDPKALAAWYKLHFGIGAYDWTQSAGPTVFTPFDAATDYFAADKAWMINFRVDELDAMLAALEGAGVEIVAKPEAEASEYGRFARVHDPEGNAIELWEPAPDAD